MHMEENRVVQDPANTLLGRSLCVSLLVNLEFSVLLLIPACTLFPLKLNNDYVVMLKLLHTRRVLLELVRQG